MQEAAQIAEEILIQSTKASLQASRETLEFEGVPANLAYELGLAQSDLYGSTLSDQNVLGVGFGEEDDFPIPRSEFAQRAVRPRPPKDEEPEEKWQVSVVRLRVTSPNFDRDDQQGRKWKAKHTGGGYYLFEIVDEYFWQKMSSREFEFSEGTDIEVQIATRVSGKGPRERKVLRVLKIDGSPVAEPLNDQALEAALGSFQTIQEGDEQKDLFS